MNRRAVGLIGLILLLAACGKTEGRSPEGLVIAIETNPVSLDPRLATDALSLHVTELLFNSLVRIDESLRIVPDLAERWERPDDRTYIFHLRRRVRFHHGRELTAEDARFTFASLREIGSVHAGIGSELAGIQVVDRYRIAFHLKRPFAPLLYHLTIGIVPHDLARQEAFGQQPVGTGPFRLKRWAHNDHVEVEAFPDYFGGMPKVRRLTLRIIPDAIIRFLEFRKGAVDLLFGSLPPEVFPFVEALPGVRVIKGSSNNSTYLGFHLRDPILKDLKVRQAIAHAIDQEALIAHLLRGQAIPATGLLFPGHWAYEPDVRRYPFNPERSRRLLDEAGYPPKDGVRFTLTFKATTNELNRAIAEAIQYQLARVGIGVEIRSYEWGTFYADIKSGNFQIYVLTWVGLTDPDYYHYIFHSESLPPQGANRGHYRSPEVDRLLTLGRELQDPGERKAVYRRVQKILAEELPYVSLWHELRWAAFKGEIHGFRLLPAGDFTPLRDVWLAGR